jgi:glutathione S-transferase
MLPVLTIASRNYGSWSLRGSLLCALAGLEVEERLIESDDPDTRAELLMLAPSFRVPCLHIPHEWTDRPGYDGEGFEIWGVLAIAEFLAERFPDAGLYPEQPFERARCRSISNEMMTGFANLRAALPMNLRADHSELRVWSAVENEVDRILAIWTDRLSRSGGPYLFGDRPTVADAMFAPVCTRFRTYGVGLPPVAADYCDAIHELPAMRRWLDLAAEEPDRIDELDAEF